MSYTDDPIADFDAHDAEETEWLEKHPKCDICGEYITDEHLYDICGEIICEECLIKHHRKDTDYYMED